MDSNHVTPPPRAEDGNGFNKGSPQKTEYKYAKAGEWSQRPDFPLSGIRTMAPDIIPGEVRGRM